MRAEIADNLKHGRPRPSPPPPQEATKGEKEEKRRKIIVTTRRGKRGGNLRDSSRSPETVAGSKRTGTPKEIVEAGGEKQRKSLEMIRI